MGPAGLGRKVPEQTEGPRWQDLGSQKTERDSCLQDRDEVGIQTFVGGGLYFFGGLSCL